MGNLQYNCLFTEHKLTDIITLPKIIKHNIHIFNQYVIRVPERDKLRQFLKEQGIATEIYYSVPFHLRECFTYLGYQPGAFPESGRAAQETLALPVTVDKSHLVRIGII